MESDLNENNESHRSSSPGYMLKNKFDEAYCDLENLKKTIRDIKSSNDSLRNRIASNPSDQSFISTNSYKTNPSHNFRDAIQESSHPITQTPSRVQNSSRPILRTIYKSQNFPENINSQLNQSNSTMPKSRNVSEVINNFKEILKETERCTGDQLNSQHSRNESKNLNNLNISKSNIYENFEIKSHQNNDTNTMTSSHNLLKNNTPYKPDTMHDNSSSGYFQNQENETSTYIKSFANRISNNSLKEQIERLRISNSVMNKSNLDIKNQNKLLQMELQSLKENNLYNFSNNLNFDKNLNIFIENLKNALNSSQMSNSELANIIDGLQIKNSELSSENQLLLEKLEAFQKEVESLNKQKSSLKLCLEDQEIQNQKLKNSVTHMEMCLREKEEKINESGEKISNLISLNENYNRNKSDMNGVIENLKATIEIMKKNNLDYEKEKSHYCSRIEELLSEKENLVYLIESWESKFKNLEKDKKILEDEHKVSQNELVNKEKYIQDLQNDYKLILADIDKTNGKSEILKYYLEEKDAVIQNLKSSMDFITATLDEVKNENEKLKNEYKMQNSDSLKLTKNLEINEKKFKDVCSSLETSERIKEQLHKINLDLESELLEKKNKLVQLNFDYDILNRKFEELNEKLKILKEENKNLKMNKINEEFQVNFLKNNDEKIKKINNMVEELKLKNREIDELKQNNEEKIYNRDQKIKELNLKINENLLNGGETEKKLTLEIRSVKLENENLIREIAKIKSDSQYYKKIQLEEYQKLQDKYSNIANMLSQYEIRNRELEEKSLIEIKEIKQVKNIIIDQPKSESYIQSDRETNPLRNSFDKTQVKVESTKEEMQIRNSKENFTFSELSSQSPKFFISDTKRNKDTINENNKNLVIVTTYDGKRILSFDTKSKDFLITKIQTDHDLLNYSQNYNEESTKIFNTEQGCFILTGDKSNMLYFYQPELNKIYKIVECESSHLGGSLVIQKSNSENLLPLYNERMCSEFYKFINNLSVIICSGRNCKKVLLIKISLGTETYDSSKVVLKSIQTYLPECKYEHCNGGLVLVDNKYLYAFWGYEYSKNDYCPAIEKLDLSQDYKGSDSEWQVVNYYFVDHLSHKQTNYLFALKSFLCFSQNENIFILGGQDGYSERENRMVLKFDLHTMTIYEMDIKNTACEKHIKSSSIPVLFDKQANPIRVYNSFENMFAVYDSFDRVLLMNLDFSVFDFWSVPAFN